METLPKSITAQFAHPKMSDKYSFVNTAELVNYFTNEGWTVRKASERKARNFDLQAYAAHEVRMQLSKFENVGDTLPEIILMNSHNGTTPLRIQMGLFRLACTNGLTVPMKEFNQDFRIRHMGIERDAVKKLTEQVAEFLPIVGERVRRMQQTEMSKEAQIEFLRTSTKLRFPNKKIEFDYAEIIEPKRDEDKNPTVWEVFNRVQENFVNGGFMLKSNNKGRKATKLNNFLTVNKLNVALWEEAEMYCPN